LLAGRVTSSAGAALAGIPVRAQRENSNIIVTIFSNGRGEHSFPAWSNVSAGTYSVAIVLPDYERVQRDAVVLNSGKTARVNFVLQPRQPSHTEATASEIAMAMPGTEEQKHLLTQCSQCHSLQHALSKARNRAGWLTIVKLMAGAARGAEDPPSSRSFQQKRYIEPMTDYLTSIRGPGSSDDLPFKLRPRPTDDASTRAVVTEYAIPRGGSTRDLQLIRGNRAFAWPHDVLPDPNGKYVWYIDQAAPVLGRVDIKTGEVKEFDYESAPQGGWVRQTRNPWDDYPGIGGHDIAFDPEGNIWVSKGGGGGKSMRFDAKTETFTYFPGSTFIGVGPTGAISYFKGRTLYRLDPKTGDVKNYGDSPNVPGYDYEADSKDRLIYGGWRSSFIGVFDPRTEKFTEYPTPTPGSGPRRGDIDSKDRYWTSLYWAGRIAVFDPNNGQIKEFPLIPDVKPYGAPYLAPYRVSVDNKHQLAWTTDFNSSRLYRFDIKTEKTTEYYMPLPFEARDIKADNHADRQTVWFPAYRPPSKVVRVEVW